MDGHQYLTSQSSSLLRQHTLKRNNNFKYISILQVVVPNVLTEVTEEEEEGAEKKKKPRKLVSHEWEYLNS